MKNAQILCCLTAAFLFVGCVGVSPRLAVPDAQPTEVQTAGMPSVRMLVWKGSLGLEVRNLTTAVKEVERIVAAQGAQVESRMSGETPWSSSGSKCASFTIRVPSPALHETMAQLKSLGHVVREEVSAEDVTAECIDVQARLQNKIVLRDRLKQLLERATNVGDVLAIEKELARVQAEIDSLDGRLKTLTDKVGMATLEVSLTRKKILGPLGYVCKGLGWVVKKLFILRD